MLGIAFLVILGAHGLIHLLGFAKAFGLAALPQLTQHRRGGHARCLEQQR